MENRVSYEYRQCIVLLFCDYCVLGIGREKRGRGERGGKERGEEEGKERGGRGEGEDKREGKERIRERGGRGEEEGRERGRGEGEDRIRTHVLIRLEPDPYILSIISKFSLSSIFCALFLTLS